MDSENTGPAPATELPPAAVRKWLDQCYFGNVCEVVPRLIAAGVRANCLVTSPPYWGLRDYGTEPVDWPEVTYAPLAIYPDMKVTIPAMRASLGLDPSMPAFIGHMVHVFRVIRPLMTDDATLWINMGDSYAGSRSGPDTGSTLEGSRRNQNEAKKARQTMTASRRRDDEPIPRSDLRIAGLKNKDLVGQPWHLALALQADGWWLRMDNIWAKRNCMPESAKDRTTKAHEYMFLMAKSERYYYDHEAIKEPASAGTHARYARGRSDHHKHIDGVGGQKPHTLAKGFDHMRKPVGGWAQGSGSHAAIDHAQHDLLPGPRRSAAASAFPGAAQRDENRRRTSKYGELTGQDSDGAHRTKASLNKPRKAAEGRDAKNNASLDAAMAVMPEDRNKRSVWWISTEGFKGAHFATFPKALVHPCILAGCPPGGVTFDPFFGSGTVGEVAQELGRHFIGTELGQQNDELQRSCIVGKNLGLPLGCATDEL